MPVTVKFSRKFYDTFGDEVANELVAWMNVVDDSYRNEFRDLFGANFGQVRAEMAALRGELRGEMAALRSESRGEMAAFRTDLESLRTELRAEIRGETAALRGEMKGQGEALRGEMAALRSEVHADIANLKAELLRWMFLFWVGTMGTVLALLKL